MSAVPSALTEVRIKAIRKQFHDLHLFRDADKVQALMDMPLSEIATYQWGDLKRNETETCAMFFVLFGHPEASVEQLLQAAGDLGISDRDLAAAAALAKHEELYKVVIAKIDGSQFKEELSDWIYIIATFGTPRMYDALANQLQGHNLEILPEIQQKLPEFFESCACAKNFDMLLHLATLVPPSPEESFKILEINKMRPYYLAAEQGHLGFVKWVLEKVALSDANDSDTMDELHRSAFGRATTSGQVQMVQNLIPLFSAKVLAELSESRAALKHFKNTKSSDPMKLTFSGHFEFADVLFMLQYQICTGDATDLEYWLANPAIAKQLTKTEFRSAIRQAGNPVISELLDVAKERLAKEKASFGAGNSNHSYFKPVIDGPFLRRLSDTSDFDEVLSDSQDSGYNKNSSSLG